MLSADRHCKADATLPGFGLGLCQKDASAASHSMVQRSERGLIAHRSRHGIPDFGFLKFAKW